MRRGFVATLVIVVVLSASLFGGLAVAVHGSTPTGLQSGVHAFATDTITPTDSTGGPTFEFTPGGAVYFTAVDPTDTSATVRINDQNATRDSLANPVASWTVNFTAGTYDSWAHAQYYKVPVALKLGGDWNITIAGTTAGFASTTFEVSTYIAESQSSPRAVLPGQPATLSYNLLWSANGAADTQVTTLEIIAEYLDATSGTIQALPGFPMTLPSPTALSSVGYVAPATASTSIDGGILFHLYANTTAGPYPNSASSITYVGVGQLVIEPVTLTPCPTCAAQLNFNTGSPAYASVTGFVDSQLLEPVPASGAQANVVFLANGVPVASSSVPGSPPATITLNSAGQGGVFFWVDVPPFSATASNAINVTLVDPWDSSANETSSQANFTTSTVTSAPVLSVFFQYSHYYAGAAVTAEWQLASYTSSGSTTGWTVGQWIAGDANTFNILATGDINSQAASGTVSFTLPASFTGTVILEIVANNATAALYAITEANVTAFVLLLTPSEATYHPGDTISVGVSFQGVKPSGVNLIETVTDPYGAVLSSGAVAVNGSFQFTIPTLATPSNVSVVVTAQNQTAGIVATQTLDLYEADSYLWSAHIATASNYIDGSFQPGQTIQIAYSLTAVGSAQLPTEFEIVIAGVSSASIPAHAILTQTTAASGQVSMTIPSNAPDGSQLIEVAALTGPGAGGVFLSYVTVTIESDPPALNYELGSGTGFTLAWLILLLLIIVIALVLVMMIRSRGRGAQPPKPPVQPYNPPSGPSPMGSGAGAWQETSSAESGAAPPMDQPPLPPPAT